MLAVKRKARDLGRQRATSYDCNALYPPTSPESSPPAENLAGEALGFLVIYLVGRDLPAFERVFGWALAERWLGELAMAPHVGGVT